MPAVHCPALALRTRPDLALDHGRAFLPVILVFMCPITSMKRATLVGRTVDVRVNEYEGSSAPPVQGCIFSIGRPTSYWAKMTSEGASVGEGYFVSMNDDRSPLLDLMNCIVCDQTMRLEKIDPNDGGDLIQYRCKLCGRIERLRLFRRSREQCGPLEAHVR